MDGFSIKDKFAIGLIDEYKIDLDFGDHVVELLQNDAYDEVGEVSYDWLDNVSKEELSKLNKDITEVVKGWLKYINQPPCFYKVSPIKELTLEEAMEKHAEDAKAKSKGGIIKNVEKL